MLSNGLSSRHIGDVQRYHIWPTVQKQNVGHHTFNVLRIYIEMFGSPPSNVTVAIVYHDAGELGTGDIPFDAKRANPDLAQVAERIDSETAFEVSAGKYHDGLVSTEEAVKIKCADLIEMLEFAIEEMRLGNVHYGWQIAEKIIPAVRVLMNKNMDMFSQYNTDYFNDRAQMARQLGGKK